MAGRQLFPVRIPAPFRLLLLLLGMLLPAGLVSAQSVVQHPFPTAITVGQSAPGAVTVTRTAPAATITVVTQTSTYTTGDFTNATGSDCTYNTAATICTVYVNFAPKGPGYRTGAVILKDGNGNVVGETLMDGVGSGPLSVLLPGGVALVAGDGTSPEWTYGEDGGVATNGHVYLPRGVVAASDGSFYIADTLNQRIRYVDTSGNINTIAGNGTASASGDNGPAINATVNQPSQVALDGAGNLYFADTNNHAIRRIDAVTKIITTVAGQLGTFGASGNNTPAAQTALWFPSGVALDADGNLFISDTNNHRILRIDAITQNSTVYAGGNGNGFAGDGGPATSAKLNSPGGLAFGPDGHTLYIADKQNNAIRKVDAIGVITTIAGMPGQGGAFQDGVPATQSTLGLPNSVAVDPAGNVYIADSGNNRVRRVSAINQTIYTVAGAYTISASTTNAYSVALATPWAISLDPQGNMLVADDFNRRILSITANKSQFIYDPMRVGKTSAGQTMTLENIGNANLDVQGFIYNSLSGGNSVLLPDSTCKTSTVLQQWYNCQLDIAFNPTTLTDAQGNNPTAALVVNSTASNTPDTINLTGTVLSVEPTSIVFSATPNPVGIGATTTLQAVVSETQGTSVPTGTVSFYEGTTLLGTGTLTGGIATATTSFATLGTHTVTVKYGGDANNASAEGTGEVSVLQNTTVKLVSSSPVVDGSPTSSVNESVTFTAAVTSTATAGGPVTTGAVTFYDGTGLLGTSALNANGQATYTTSSLTGGVHVITAVFKPADTVNASSTSNGVRQVVTKVFPNVNLVLTPTTIILGDPVQMVATMTNNIGHVPTGTVKFINGKYTLLGIPAVKDGVATYNMPGVVAGSQADYLLTPGTLTIDAQYSGDAWNNGNDGYATLIVNRIPTVTTMTSGTNPSTVGSSITLTAKVVVNPSRIPIGAISGVVTFYDGTSAIGAGVLDSTGTATLTTGALTVGVHDLTAQFTGNTNYDVSTSAVVQQTVRTSASANLLTMTLSPTALSIPSGKYGVTYVTLQSMNNFTDTMSLGCLGLPYAATCTFDKDTVKLAANGSVRVKVVVDTGNPLTEGGSVSTNTGMRNGRSAMLALLPAAALLLFLKRRRRIPGLLLVMLALLLPVVGCGSLDQTSTPAGSYTVSIGATGTTGVTATDSLAVTVTK